ncbi:MAG: DUF1549 domain-containing protein [Deltaproteobacteria bacterium]|nr:DUF1549 domain-containing protein [Deltaproteobacteria bacterium]
MTKQRYRTFAQSVLGLVGIVAGCAFPLAARAAEELETQAHWLPILLGKLHPVAVHFPIGLITFAALVEVYGLLRRTPHPSVISLSAVGFGSIMAVVAAAFGWLNASHEEYQGELVDILFVHRWGGVAIAALAVLTALVGWRCAKAPTRRTVNTFRLLTFVCGAGVGLTAHFGGLMVHGPDYYTEIFDSEDSRLADTELGESGKAQLARTAAAEGGAVLPAAATKDISYIEDVHPIFEKHCMRCHGNGRDKGGFNLDTREKLIAGGETGPGIVVGNGAESLLIDLVSGKQPKKIMPNKGRRLTPDELSTLRAWIDQGAHYGEKKAHSRAPVKKVPTTPRDPALPTLTPAQLKDLGEFGGSSNPIDQIVGAYFIEKKVTPGKLVDDRRFLRRIYGDILGLIPTPEEAAAFEADLNVEKRQRMVEKLLARDQQYAIHWMTFWNDALRNDYSGPGFLHGGRSEITKWLYDSLRANKPYNVFVSELVNPGRDNRGFITGIRWWKKGVVNANEEPAIQAAQNIGQVFMGINVKCASCHDSFTDEWTLEDRYGLANVFTARKLQTHECNVPTGKEVSARFVYPEVGGFPEKASLRSRRKIFASLLTSDANGRFARTFVNRVWARFFGWGIIEPLDEMDNIPWSQDLIDWLSVRFAKDGYDSKKLIALILTSHAYQLEARPSAEKHFAHDVFAGPVVRRIQVEQLLDSVSLALDVDATALPGDIERMIATEVRTDAPVGSPRLIYSSGPLQNRDGIKSIELDVRGARSLWLVALRRYDYKSKLDKLREQFDAVQKSDEGITDSLQASLKERGARARYETKTRKDVRKAKQALFGQEYSAVWDAPVVFSKGRAIPLLQNKSSKPSVYVDHEETEAIQSANAIGIEDVRENDPSRTKTDEVRFEGNTIVTRAFSAVKFSLEDIDAEKFKTSVRVDSDPDSDRRVEFVIITDLDVRSVLRDASDFMLAMGRPRREQITTRRPPFMSTMDALVLSNADELQQLIRRSAERTRESAARSGATKLALAEETYLRLLSRKPTTAERTAIDELLSPTPSIEEIESLIWGIIALPEFQLVT